MSPVPTANEIMRRLDEVVTELRRLADTLETGYVRKDVLAAQINAIEVQISGLEAERREDHKRITEAEEARATDRRLIVTSFIAPVIVGIIFLILASSNGLHR